MTAKVRVPFGLRAGVLVEPSSVANGKACDCVCPGCGRPLIAYNQGTKRTLPYFGHQPGEDCQTAVESAIHLASKEVLLREKRMQVPALRVNAARVAVRPDHYPRCSQVLEPARLARYDWVVSEVNLTVQPPSAAPPKPVQVDLFAADPHPAAPAAPKILRADIRADEHRRSDWIEIRVTHGVSQQKKRMFQRAGCYAIEVDLSRFLRGQVTLEDIRRAVIDDVAGKTWLAHPALPVLPEVEDVEDDELNNVCLRPTWGYTPIAPAVEAPSLPPNWRENLSLQKDDPFLRPVKKSDSERPH